MKFRLLSLIVVGGSLALAGCSESADTHSAAGGPVNSATRWYTQQQVSNGGVTFQKYCASCHQTDASGTGNWRQKDAEGKYPPPPLNGTAHTWHHHMDGLRRTIRMGGVPLGGSMPGFGDKLTNQEIDEVLAWVQSHWSDRIYAAWLERDKQASR